MLNFVNIIRSIEMVRKTNMKMSEQQAVAEIAQLVEKAEKYIN